MKRLIFLIMVLLPEVIFGQVFSVVPGSPLSDYEVIQEVKPGYYEIKVPKPNDMFKFYLVEVDPVNGITDLIAMTDIKSMNSFADEPLADISKIEDMIKPKYGEPTLFMKAALPGSIWNEKNELAYALYRNEAKIFSAWEIKDDIVSDILIFASAQSLSSYMVSVGFKFKIESTVEEESIF